MSDRPNTKDSTHGTLGRFSPVMLLATGLGFGFSPFMPGTVGALWGLPLTWAVANLPKLGPGEPVWLQIAIQIAVIVILGAIGVPLCTAAARRLGGAKDPGSVVWDEISTMPIAFFLVRAGQLSDHPWVFLAGFVLHRVFDIWKPPPCRWLEHLPTGLGIMADDWASSVYACLALHALLWLTGI